MKLAKIQLNPQQHQGQQPLINQLNLALLKKKKFSKVDKKVKT